MRIGIDARRMFGQKTGVGVYMSNLFEAVWKIDKKNEYCIFYKNIETLKERSRVFGFLVPLYVDIFHKQLILPVLIFLKRINIFYCANPPVPYFALCPNVVTIHDIEVPPRHKLLYRLWFFLYYLSCRKAKKVIVDSLNTKKDLIDIMRVPEEKIKVIYPGVSEKFRQVTEKRLLNSIRNKYGIEGRFILTVIGTFILRKNVQRLILAYSNLPEKTKQQYKLVIVGKKEGSLYHKVLKSIDDLGLTSNVIIAGYVPDEELSLLYSAADLFVFLSSLEGFGLPPLEAMACGVPIVVSNTSSLPEVVGGAGILVDPANIAEITAAISKTLADEHLRRELIQAGLQQAKLFSWENAAREALKVFGEVHHKTFSLHNNTQF